MISRLAVAVTIALWTGPALADWFGVGRAGFLGGLYFANLELTARDGNGDLVGREKLSQTRTALGVSAGYTIATGMFFADLAVEYQSTGSKGETFFGQEQNFSFDRTDVLPSVGVFLPHDFSLSAGFRAGWQGDGPFDDRFYRELGPFIGVGFPSFAVYGDWALSTSLAVNFTKLEFDDFAQEPDFLGISLRGALSRPGSPHSFGARVQRFSGSETEPEGSFDVKAKIAETYLHLFYQFSFLEMER